MKKYLFFLLTISMLLSAKLFSKDPGDVIDDFTIKNYDGNIYTLSEVKDAKAVVIMFWSTQCPNVQAYNDRINELVSTYQQKGFVFWAINSNNTESSAEVAAHSSKNNYVFPVLKDENSKVADLFGATRTPEVFVLNSNREILYHGRIDDNRDIKLVTTHDLQNALDDIYNGRDVAVKTTKQFGCTIKRN